VRALLCERLCNFHYSMKGADDDELFGEVLAHVRRDHPTMPFPRSSSESSSPSALTTSSMRRCMQTVRARTRSSVSNLTELLKLRGDA
jgi:hypothetical protein